MSGFVGGNTQQTGPYQGLNDEAGGIDLPTRLAANNLPPANTVPIGTRVYVIGQGPRYSDGVNWNPLGGYTASFQTSASQRTPPITVSPPPVVTVNSAKTATQTIQSLIGGGTLNLPNTNNFNLLGVGFSSRANAVPQSSVLGSGLDDSTAPDLVSEFWHSGPMLDLGVYVDGNDFALWVDDQYIGSFRQPFATGTAQAGAANAITLAAAASAVNGEYNQYTVIITGGTGAGQKGYITGYVGGTKVATVSANWTTVPDATSIYSIVEDVNGYYILPTVGAFVFVNLNWGTIGTRKITFVGPEFGSVTIGANDTLWPSTSSGAMRMLTVGDSFINDTGAPLSRNPAMSRILAKMMGCSNYTLGNGGTGWATGPTAPNFANRIAPPAESWAYYPLGGTGGSFTVSVTYNGSTQTTAPIALFATGATAVAAVQALSNVNPGNAAGWRIGRQNAPYVFILNNMPGAVLTVDSSSIVAATQIQFSLYTGSVAPRVPLDGGGNPLPFILYVQGSGNDFGTGVTAAALRATVIATAQQIVARFPTAITIFSGIVATSTQGGGAIGANDLAFNAAIQAGAQLLTPVNGNVPFIDTYAAGLGGNGWIFGAGNVGAPTANTNDILKSITVSGHPTGDGHYYLASRIAQNMKQLLGMV